MNKRYTIKEVSEIFNITKNKIRFYEKKGLINPERDKFNNYRYFKEKDLIKLQTILMYRVLDLSIHDIKDIFNDNRKDNELDHFYNQWEVINSRMQKMKLIRDALKELMDIIYISDSKEYKGKMVDIIKDMNEIYKLKEDWKDKWDFDTWSKTYDETVKNDPSSLKIYENYEKILNNTFKTATKDKTKDIKILDIGVGTGNLSKLFLERGYDILGLDQSREMLNVAKNKFPNLKLRPGDFLKIPFENNSFDIIVSTYAFHHLNNEEKKVAIKEMINVLNKNGRIVIGDLMFEDDKEKEKIMKSLSKEEIYEIEDEYYSNIKFLEREFKSYGKKLEKVRIDKFNFIIEVN
ncbi:MAG: methyltransferase domain-containing protein [Firmicutes bacterium]|nr:methyltransferase domain-containing protein [Bacillota bacterium]